jgi:hypothetical protein
MRLLNGIYYYIHVLVLPWPVYSPDMSPVGMLWIDVYDSMFQFPPITSNLALPLKSSGTAFNWTQLTAWSTLCEGDVALRKANGGHTRYGLFYWSWGLSFNLLSRPSTFSNILLKIRNISAPCYSCQEYSICIWFVCVDSKHSDVSKTG